MNVGVDQVQGSTAAGAESAPEMDDGGDERIVRTLLAKGRLKEPDLARARRLQAETGGSLLGLLARLGLVSERDHADACASVLDLPLVSTKDLPELPPELSPDGPALTLKFMKQFHVVPIAEAGALRRARTCPAGRPPARRARRLLRRWARRGTAS